MAVEWLAGSAVAVALGLVLAVAGTLLGNHQHYRWYFAQAVGVPLVLIGGLNLAIAVTVVLVR